MKLTLLEKYGDFFVFFFVSLVSWRFISLGVQRVDEFAILFPINWLSSIPLVDIQGVIAPFQSAPWWMWLEIGVTLTVWTLILASIRGGYYYCSNMEGASMWIGFTLYIVVMFILFAIIMEPTFEIVEGWWLNWPQVERQVYPGS